MKNMFQRQMLSQRGSALIISLVILLVVTIIGIGGVQGTQLQMKMVGSVQDRNIAFGFAEAALAAVERELIDNPPQLAELDQNCVGPGCFTESCNDGRCFSGEFDATQDRRRCRVLNNTSTERWRVANFWDDRANAEYTRRFIDDVKDGLENEGNLVSFAGDLSGQAEVKILIDFMCFTPINDDVPLVVGNSAGDTFDPDSFAPLFRITAYAQGSAGRSEVLLQSTLRLAGVN